MKLVLRFVIVLIATLMIDYPARAQSRLALVIGNSSYDTAPLPNPVKDAALMTKTLKQAGFKVTTIINANQKTMKRALIAFGRNLRKSDAVGLFYYAGHGVQVKGENYLIPVGIDIQDETEVEIEAINVNAFLATMERSSSAINIVILDACRNNPFTRSFRSLARGLAEVSAPRGSYIAYATAPGQVAYDGDFENSPYTFALAKAIATPNLTIEQVFKQARSEVLKLTKDRQTPWENSSIIGDFYFNRHPKISPSSQPVPPVLMVDDTIVEMSLWGGNTEEDNQSLFKSYLEQYPKDQFLLSEVAPEKNRSVLEKSDKLSQNRPKLPIKYHTVLTKLLQTELARVGCTPGRIDGKWGPTGKTALRRFNHFADKTLKISTATHDAYQTIRRTNIRVCPTETFLGSHTTGYLLARLARKKPRPPRAAQAPIQCGIFNGDRFCRWISQLRN